LQGPIDINDYLQNDIAIFRVICYKLAEGPAIGNLELTIISSDAHDLMVQWVGIDTFTYDANGTIKWEAAKQEKTLYAKFSWMEGKATDYRIEVLAPDGAVLGDRNVYPMSENGGGYNIEDSMVQDMWVDS
jgi:hypothetical protein